MTKFAPGSRVKMLCSGSGGVYDDNNVEHEIHYLPGTLGTVLDIEWYASGQGLTITIEVDGGVVNVFDQTDAPPFPFELVHEAPPAPETLKPFYVEVVQTGVRSFFVPVQARDADHAAELVSSAKKLHEPMPGVIEDATVWDAQEERVDGEIYDESQYLKHLEDDDAAS